MDRHRSKLRLPVLILALTSITPILALDPRIVDLRDEHPISRRTNEMELMEAGQLPRPSPPSASQLGLETPSNSLTEQDMRVLQLLDDLDPYLPGPSSPRQQAAIQQQRQQQRMAELRQQREDEDIARRVSLSLQNERLEEMRRQQQENVALTEAPPSQHMSSETEPASPAIPLHAVGTGTPSSQAQCLRCFKSCVGCVANKEEALSAYCNAGNGTCACGSEGWDCAVATATCCGFLGSLAGGLALIGLYAMPSDAASDNSGLAGRWRGSG